MIPNDQQKKLTCRVSRDPFWPRWSNTYCYTARLGKMFIEQKGGFTKDEAREAADKRLAELKEKGNWTGK